MTLAELILSIVGAVLKLGADLIAMGAKGEEEARAWAAGILRDLSRKQADLDASQRVRRAAEDADAATFPSGVVSSAPPPVVLRDVASLAHAPGIAVPESVEMRPPADLDALLPFAPLAAGMAGGVAVAPDALPAAPLPEAPEGDE